LALVRGSPRTRANQKKWGIFKCPFRGILLRHQQQAEPRATQATIEAFDIAVLLWLARRDIMPSMQRAWTIAISSGW
jgi:hypothetical protein